MKLEEAIQKVEKRDRQTIMLEVPAPAGSEPARSQHAGSEPARSQAGGTEAPEVLSDGDEEEAAEEPDH
eukprot:4325489-Alexandrium_andersonii.AAC.1